jgi:hypothetical protein
MTSHLVIASGSPFVILSVAENLLAFRASSAKQSLGKEKGI